jgi:peptide subunit release factor 1 (eRF1)
VLTADALRPLADLSAPERAFLTLYLDAEDDDSVLDSRLERIRSLLSDQPDETEHFEQSLEVARGLLREHAAPEGGALAVFASWGADLAAAVPLPVAVGSMAWMGDAPYVRPLYEMLDENETFAVAVVDNTRARVFVVSAEEAAQEASVRGDVKNRVKKGGWSQKRYARRRQKELNQYAQDVADALADLYDEQAFSRLVLLGSEETALALQDALRTDLAELLVATDTAETDAPEAELVAQAAELSEEAEREEEEDLWREIREQGLSGALGAFGPTHVLEALTAARAEAVLLDREAALHGTKCRDCEHVVHGTPETCQRCGSADVFGVDLAEVLTERAAQTGASIDYADPLQPLAEAGGVAALLRY